MISTAIVRQLRMYSGMHVYNWHQIGFHQSEQKAKTSDLPKSAIHKSYVCNGI